MTATSAAGINSRNGVPYFPQAVKAEIRQFAQDTNNMAREILSANGSSATYDGPVVIRHYHHYSSPWYFWGGPCYTPSYVIVDGDSARRRGEADRIALGVIALIGAAIASYFVGSALSKLSDSSEILEETRAFKNSVSQFGQEGLSGDRERIYNAVQVANLKERIATRLHRSAAIDLALRVGFAGGLALTGVGLAFSAPVSIPAALTVTIGSFAGMMFKWGFDSTDTKNFRDAQLLQRSLQPLLS